MNYLDTFSLESTIRDYEFTRKARHQIFDVVSTKSFEDMAPDGIFSFLYKSISLVSFKDYLKRYLYERSGMTEPFRTIDDSVWMDTIISAFEENNAPHSLEPTTTRWNATVKSWLSSDRVRRSTVFLLGFGLKMTEEDVSDFLTKVLEEDSYHMTDPAEVIWRYCYRHALPYARALALSDQSNALKPSTPAEMTSDQILADENSLLQYLAGLKNRAKNDLQNGASIAAFRSLFEACKEEIVRIYNQDEEACPEKERRNRTVTDITAGDLEKMLCSGIPVTESGNLAKANQSLLNRHFQNYRPSRQRIDSILKGAAKPDRYDLITLAFFIHAQKEETFGDERLNGFLSEVNPLLQSCGMSEIHPANPYEAFVLICILSDCPMAVYADIWEMAYDQSGRDA